MKKEERGKERPLPLPSFPLFSFCFQSFPVFHFIAFLSFYFLFFIEGWWGKEERMGRVARKGQFHFPPKGMVTRPGPVRVLWEKGGGPMSKRYWSQKTKQTGDYRYAQPYSLHNACSHTNFYFGFNSHD